MKWNSLERVVLNSTGCFERTVNVYFYLLFVFYFMVAGFTYLSQLLQVDYTIDTLFQSSRLFKPFDLVFVHNIQIELS